MDDELAIRAGKGDREAFGQLVRRYAGQARRIGRAILGNDDDADDAAQDGFLKALRRLDSYDPSRAFGPWLLKIVANSARDLARRRKLRAGEELNEDRRSDAVDPEQAAIRGDLRVSLSKALASLPERRRMVVTLFDVEGYSHKEIASVLDIPEGTVRSDLSLARKSLREVLRNLKES